MTYKKRIIAGVTAFVMALLMVVSSFAAFAEDPLYGDANGDGTVDVNDATCIQKVIVGKTVTQISPNYSTLADVNGDKDVNIRDVTLIQMRVALIIELFPIEDWDPHIIQP